MIDPTFYVLGFLTFAALAIPLGRRRGRRQAELARGAEAGLEFSVAFAATGAALPRGLDLKALALSKMPPGLEFRGAWQEGFCTGFEAGFQYVRRPALSS